MRRRFSVSAALHRSGSKAQNLLPYKCELEFFINLSLKEEISTDSEIGWITKDKLILTLNNEFYLVNLHQRSMVEASPRLHYGIQQVHMEMFCSLVHNPKAKSSNFDISQIKNQQFDLKTIYR